MGELENMMTLLGKTDLLAEQYRAAAALQDHLDTRELTIAVIGQFKRGKSSVINAMLGEELLPVAIIPLTTVVTELRWGERFRGQVCYLDGRTQELDRDSLADYCSEENNPGNRKQVAAVKLWTPRQPFGRGVVLVDTPGVGSVHRHNTDSSYAYVEHSDAVLFLLSVDSPVSETEREFLLRTRQFAASFCFAVNKADTVSQDDLQTFLSFCSRVLGEAMGTEVELSAVSARTGSGIPELVQRLRRELGEGEGLILEASVRKKLELIRDKALASLKLAIQAASLPSQELTARLDRVRQELHSLEGFGEEVTVLARYRTEQLVERVGEALDRRVEALQQETEEKGAELWEKLQDSPRKLFEDQLRKELEAFLRTKLGELDREGQSLLEEGYSQLTALLTGKARETARFLSALLREELGTDYPVPELAFQVSQRSDLTLHLGAPGSLLLDPEVLARLLPRRQANARCYRRSMEQALRDLRRNRNNVLSNYRYKMQESLRPLCRELTEEVVGMSGELRALISHLESHLEDAREKRGREEALLTTLLAELEQH